MEGQDSGDKPEKNVKKEDVEGETVSCSIFYLYFIMMILSAR